MECFIYLIRPVKREKRAAEIHQKAVGYGDAGAEAEGHDQEDVEQEVQGWFYEYVVSELHQGPEHVEVTEILEPTHGLTPKNIILPCTLDGHTQLKHLDGQRNEEAEPNPVRHQEDARPPKQVVEGLDAQDCVLIRKNIIEDWLHVCS